MSVECGRCHSACSDSLADARIFCQVYFWGVEMISYYFTKAVLGEFCNQFLFYVLFLSSFCHRFVCFFPVVYVVLAVLHDIILLIGILVAYLISDFYMVWFGGCGCGFLCVYFPYLRLFVLFRVLFCVGVLVLLIYWTILGLVFFFK